MHGVRVVAEGGGPCLLLRHVQRAAEGPHTPQGAQVTRTARLATAVPNLRRSHLRRGAGTSERVMSKA